MRVPSLPMIKRMSILACVLSWVHVCWCNAGTSTGGSGGLHQHRCCTSRTYDQRPGGMRGLTHQHRPPLLHRGITCNCCSDGAQATGVLLMHCSYAVLCVLLSGQVSTSSCVLAACCCVHCTHLDASLSHPAGCSHVLVRAWQTSTCKLQRAGVGCLCKCTILPLNMAYIGVLNGAQLISQLC